MTYERQRILTGTMWEERNGYARAVRVGPFVYVSGTIAADESGNIHAPDSPYLQTIYAFEKIERALHKLGATRSDVVRTRIFVTNMRNQDEAGRAHLEFFRDVMPCCTLLEVGALASPMALIEVEADALIASDLGPS